MGPLLTAVLIYIRATAVIYVSGRPLPDRAAILSLIKSSTELASIMVSRAHITLARLTEAPCVCVFNNNLANGAEML